MALVLFSQQQLDDIVRRVLPPESDMPEGKRGAVVITADQTGATAAVMFQLDQAGMWRAKAAFHHDWTGDNLFGAQISAYF